MCMYAPVVEIIVVCLRALLYLVVFIVHARTALARVDAP